MNGKLVCFGTQEQLKKQYANSYFILLTNPKVPHLDHYLKENFFSEDTFEKVSDSQNIDSGIK